MTKYKVGDVLIDENYPKYTHKITKVDNKLYYYDVYQDGKFAWKHDFLINEYDAHESIRKQTKLDKALK